MLQEEGHSVVAISKKAGNAHGIDFDTDQLVYTGIDTISMYISPQHQDEIMEYVFSINPKRVIFNPGTENAVFSKKLRDQNIKVENACTLVLLRIGAY
jgi:predicted CoA-binding protein